MAEILDFNDDRGKLRKEDKVDEKKTLAALVWCCAGCGNTTFQLLQDGSVRCAHCNLASTDLAHFNPNER